MNTVEIRATRNPSLPIWQVPPPNSDYEVLLVGWILREAPLDSGLPEEAGGLLTQTLTHLSAVTFLHPASGDVDPPANQWRTAEGGWATLLSAPGIASIRKRELPLFCTLDPEKARMLFHAEPFDWTQQGQLALLTDKKEAPPALDYHLIEQAFHRKSLSTILRSEHSRLLGLVYPGVDGDFAALLSADEAFVSEFLQGLRHTCEAAGIFFRVTSEDEFQQTAWLAPPG